MFIKKKDAAKILGVSVQTITNYMKRGMPYYKRGRTVRFEADKIIEWFKNEVS